MESCSRIKDGNWRFTLEEVEVRWTWNEYFVSICVDLMGFGKATTSEEN